MTHGPDPVHVDFAYEFNPERRAARSVEPVPDIEMLLDQLLCLVRHFREGVDSIGTDRDNYEAVAGKDFSQIVITSITRDGRESGRAGPGRTNTLFLMAWGVPSVNKYQQRERSIRQIHRMMNHRSQLDCVRGANRRKCLIAEIVLIRCNRKRSCHSWIGNLC